MRLSEMIEDHLLSVRTANCLTYAGLTEWQDITTEGGHLNDKMLLKIRNFGRRSLNELKDCYDEHRRHDRPLYSATLADQSVDLAWEINR